MLTKLLPSIERTFSRDRHRQKLSSPVSRVAFALHETFSKACLGWCRYLMHRITNSEHAKCPMKNPTMQLLWLSGFGLACYTLYVQWAATRSISSVVSIVKRSKKCIKARILLCLFNSMNDTVAKQELWLRHRIVFCQKSQSFYTLSLWSKQQCRVVWIIRRIEIISVQIIGQQPHLLGMCE